MNAADVVRIVQLHVRFSTRFGITAFKSDEYFVARSSFLYGALKSYCLHGTFVFNFDSIFRTEITLHLQWLVQWVWYKWMENVPKFSVSVNYNTNKQRQTNSKQSQLTWLCSQPYLMNSLKNAPWISIGVGYRCLISSGISGLCQNKLHNKIRKLRGCKLALVPYLTPPDSRVSRNPIIWYTLTIMGGSDAPEKTVWHYITGKPNS